MQTASTPQPRQKDAPLFPPHLTSLLPRYCYCHWSPLRCSLPYRYCEGN